MGPTCDRPFHRAQHDRQGRGDLRGFVPQWDLQESTGGSTSGTYRCVVIDLENGLARTVGTVVAS